VTPEELAKWESLHNSRISHIIGIVRDPEIVLDVDTFDFSFLWQDNFQRMLIVWRDEPEKQTESMYERIANRLRARFESERVRYERELKSFDEVLKEKLTVKSGKHITSQIEAVLLYRGVEMNNLWV